MSEAPDPSSVLLTEIAASHYVNATAITGSSREAHIVAARRAVARALRVRGLSLHSIGRVLNRDHTTVVNLLQRDGWTR